MNANHEDRYVVGVDFGTLSGRAVVVSGHPLASEAGRVALARGGNIVDAAVAVSFALGVVEPDASGIGGDGQAVLFLKGMSAPTVIDFKDQTPKAAALDNPRIFRGGRLVGDGPASANIPGVVGGLDYLYRKYGSGKVKWAELIDPSVALAEEGFILDEALPTSIAGGRNYLEKYPEAARIYLPDGNVPRPGDRFVNKDYATTLRAIARDGAETFYRGDIARKIAADMKQNGGIIPSFVDLDGRIGGPDGKWWNHAYGWGFSPVNPVTGKREDRNRIPRA